MLWASRLQFSIAAAGVNRCKRLACGCAKPRLTHESSVALRQRLRICSPAETLTKLLESRVRRCQDAASCRIFRDILTLLQSLNARDEHIPAGSCLRAVAADCEVFCQGCGQQFGNMRHLLSHIGRKHPELVTHDPVDAQASPYATHLLDGRPTCRHCRRQFKRHEALKKHLRGACPVLHGRKAIW